MTRPRVLPPWWMAACRRRFGLSPTRPPGMPKPAPKWCLEEWDKFLVWSGWRDSGAHPPRPKNTWPYDDVPQWAWDLRVELVKHREHGKPPVPKAPAVLPPSFVITHPLILSGNFGDPGALYGHDGVGSVGRIVDEGNGAPLWKITAGNTPDGAPLGWVAQVEGDGQIDTALGFRAQHPDDPFAIIGIGGTNPHRFIEAGITTYLVELNGQVALEPYANTEHMVWQIGHEGWPHVHPSYGVYGSMSLADYANYDPLVWRNGVLRRLGRPQGLDVPGAVFSADGCSDTGSWPTVADWPRGGA